MTLNTTLLHPDQNAWLSDAEVAALLVGADLAAWNAAAVARREAAILDCAADVQYLRWRGEPFFARRVDGYPPQPWRLPTAATGDRAWFTAGAASTPSLIDAAALSDRRLSSRPVGGSLVLCAAADPEYRVVRRVVAVDPVARTLALDAPFAASPAGKTMLLVWPLDRPLRVALALQCCWRLDRRDHHALAQAISEGAGDARDGRRFLDVGPARRVWNERALGLLQPYLRAPFGATVRAYRE